MLINEIKIKNEMHLFYYSKASEANIWRQSNIGQNKQTNTPGGSMVGHIHWHAWGLGSSQEGNPGQHHEILDVGQIVVAFSWNLSWDAATESNKELLPLWTLSRITKKPYYLVSLLWTPDLVSGCLANHLSLWNKVRWPPFDTCITRGRWEQC